MDHFSVGDKIMHRVLKTTGKITNVIGISTGRVEYYVTLKDEGAARQELWPHYNVDKVA